MSIETLYTTCNELKSISSTTDKKTFLKAHKDDEELIALFKFLLNPRIVTGLNTAKLNKPVPTVRGFIAGLDNLYLYLENNNTGRDKDIALCQGFVEPYPEYKAFLYSIITKTLKLGVDVKTVNAVYGKDFIHVHEVQQGSPRDKLRLKKDETFYLSLKLNGVRCTFVNGELISRQGVPFKGLDHIVDELKMVEKAFCEPFVFDGELIRKNVDGLPDNENFRIGTGIINSDDADKSCIEFVMFDLLPLDEFNNGQSTESYSQRKAIMQQIEVKFANQLNHVRIVPFFYEGSDQKQIDVWLKYADEHNFEGLMLNKDAPYYCKRHTGLIKIKTFLYSDLKVIGYEEGTNKYEGMLGAVIVDYKGNPVNVGSGFTDEQRIEYWANKEKLIGKIVEVKYKEESSDKKTGLKSLQFPVFVCMRDDKTEESLES